MRFGSVCSGIEAASVAWGPLGWAAEFFAEIEPFPKAVLAHHYPDTPDLGDMTRYRSWNRGPIDLLVGGTPCQSFSVAGLRKGMADPRGNLALVFLGLVDRFRPRWVVWENVPGVRSSSEGRDFGAFLGGLAELGYGWAYRSLDAQYFDLAQRRERVFVVAHSGDWRPSAAVLFEPESLSGHSAPSREAGEVAAGTLNSSLGRRGGQPGCNGELDNLVNGMISDALTARRAGDPQPERDAGVLITHSLRSDGFDASEDGTGRGTPIVAFSCKDRGQDAGELAPTLRSMNHGQVAVFQSKASPSQSMNPGEVSPSLDVGKGDGIAVFSDPRRHDDNHRGGMRERPSLNASNNDLLLSQAAVRRLTPRECERLQGFPDDYTLVPYRGKPAADGPRYRALGNSMAVPVMRWIGQRINLVERVPADLRVDTERTPK